MLVYKITNTVNGKLYIGITTKTLETRWSAHASAANAGRSYPLYNAIRKYGVAAFLVEPVCSALSVDSLKQLEQEFISEYRTQISGYNATAGGDGVFGLKFSDAARNKMSLSAKARPPMSEETRRKIGAAHKGKIRTREEIEKGLEKMRGRVRTKEHIENLKHSLARTMPDRDWSSVKRKYPIGLVQHAINRIRAGESATKLARETGISNSHLSKLTKNSGQKYVIY